MTTHEHSGRSNGGLADFVSDTMRHRPEALLLMAAGAALMLTRGRGFGLSELWSGYNVGRDAAQGIGERIHAAADSATHLASDMRERVGEQVDDLRETVSDYAERAAHSAQEKREDLTRRTGAAIERARSSMQENIDYMLREQPLALGAVSLLAGIAIGAALPRTEIEADVAGLAREPLREGASRREAFIAAAAAPASSQSY
jgi:ElaB/YqjD/DUF883 family membrane-anchored ribosome-binding protein